MWCLGLLYIEDKGDHELNWNPNESDIDYDGFGNNLAWSITYCLDKADNQREEAYCNELVEILGRSKHLSYPSFLVSKTKLEA